MSNPYLDRNTTITEAVSDQELGKQLRMRQAQDVGYQTGMQTKDASVLEAYQQGITDGLASMLAEQDKMRMVEHYRKMDSEPEEYGVGDVIPEGTGLGALGVTVNK